MEKMELTVCYRIGANISIPAIPIAQIPPIGAISAIRV